jgi:2-keto-3-deoxy-L-rhamnonate aldolase RhmA
MGHLEEHPETAKVIDDANRKIVASGRNAGASVTDDNVDLYLDQGVTFLMSDWDGWLEKGAKAYLNRVSTAFA